MTGVPSKAGRRWWISWSKGDAVSAHVKEYSDHLSSFPFFPLSQKELYPSDPCPLPVPFPNPTTGKQNESRATFVQQNHTLCPPVPPLLTNFPVCLSNFPKHSELTPLKHQTNPFKIPNGDLCAFPSQDFPNGKNSYHSVSDASHFVLPQNWNENSSKAPPTIDSFLANSIDLFLNAKDPAYDSALGMLDHRDNTPSVPTQNLEINQEKEPPYPKASRLVCSPPYVKLPPPTPIGSQKSRGRWVRPLGYAERFMSKAHEYGCMSTIYAVWLNSKRPVPFTYIKQAASIMYRKMPHLRLALGHHRGDRWWREMETEKVDVEELITSSINATVEDLLKRRYRMEEGPLWFTRFITLDPEEGKDPASSSSQQAKHRYVCVFGFHHNVTDGTTNMKFCRVFLEVLNCMLEGRDVDMKQEGYFAEPLHDRLADSVSSRWHMFLIFVRRFYKGMLCYGAFVRNFTRHYRMTRRRSAATHVLHHELDETTTEKLLRRCREERVTLNSAFITAANLALYNMIVAKDPSIKSSPVNSLQAINMRRYWPKDKQPDTFGCHISMLDVSFVVKREHFQCFWDCARLVHATILHQLNKARHPLIVQPMSERLKLVIVANSFLNHFRLPSTNDNHYCVTNMGDLSAVFPGTGPVVEASKVMRSVSCHFMSTLCQHTIHTFRGKLSYSLDYYTQKMSKETATTYGQEIFKVLRSSVGAPK
ncbi:LOW QUALITY PROTEIN: uncharacterized protein [Macrobrachium rosenbergii]|uniref:LOW QUALITY PROTEIN: uncharacterized protein n=1 Tax=Macrobrachium rosenbergii TaxID=79674 RepID=UPI0034D6CBA8